MFSTLGGGGGAQRVRYVTYIQGENTILKKLGVIDSGGGSLLSFMVGGVALGRRVKNRCFPI